MKTFLAFTNGLLLGFITTCVAIGCMEEAEKNLVEGAEEVEE